MPSQNHRLRRAVATVLVSGGIDSASCLAYYLGKRLDVAGIFVDYGQLSAPRERRAARLITGHFHVPLKTLKVRGASTKREGLIVHRNAFLLLTAALELGDRAGQIVIGIHSGTKYRDCSPAFVRKTQELIDICTGGRVQISAPFLNWRKGDVWTYAIEKKVPLALTYSCERGVVQPCGSCDSCRDLEAFNAGARHED
jgi:7-cyano-7-deazaguanine synthase